MEKQKYNWLPDFVYGGIDGTVTTFAVVAGVVGGNLSTPVILILGFANLFADGFSMAVSKYSSDHSELERIQHITAMERRSIRENPEEEKQEIREILRGLNFKGRDLVRAEKVITSSPEAWVHMMLHHEFHVVEENIQPVKGAAFTFAAFLLMGSVPLIAYVFQSFFELADDKAFIITIIATLASLTVVGAIRGKFSERRWWISALETTAIGGAAASIAYIVGKLLSQLLGVL